MIDRASPRGGGAPLGAVALAGGGVWRIGVIATSLSLALVEAGSGGIGCW